MTSLLMDPTTPGEFLIVLRQGKKRVIHRQKLPPDYSVSVLNIFDDALRRSGTKLSMVSRLLLVAGPGRFSSVRNAAVLTTILGWALHVPVFQLRRPGGKFENHDRYIDALENQSSRQTRVVRPVYGQPPSITLPKKKA